MLFQTCKLFKIINITILQQHTNKNNNIKNTSLYLYHNIKSLLKYISIKKYSIKMEKINNL